MSAEGPGTGAEAGAQDVGPVPAAAATLFGDRLELARRYVDHLSTTGVTHGLIGPREVPRLWGRHVLNCAVIAPVFDRDASVADVGSGAGLPGLVLAIARPDLQVHLVEPLQRRTTWLEAVVDDLGLTAQVSVHRGRAEQLWGRLAVDTVTSRAVAQLGELARLSLPLLRPGGSMVALKGERAADELHEDREILKRLRVSEAGLLELGQGVVAPVSTVVVLRVDGQAPQISEPVGPGPARTAAAKKARRRERRRGTGD